MQAGDADIAVFVEAVAADKSIPLLYLEQVKNAECLERHVLHESYLAFLREQIDLAPRGPEWTAVLAKRLKALAPFCGCSLVTGLISTSKGGCLIDVDTITRRVIRWEEHEVGSEGQE